MEERRRVVLLILILAVVSMTVAAVTIRVLYRAAYDEESARLTETAQSQARLIEAIARFHTARVKSGAPGYRNARDATLSQIMDALSRYEGFGKTGEFTLAHREGDQIVFLLRHRRYDLDKPKPVPFASEIAEPMRLALLGNSGTIKGLDYRGKTVLAAYEPVGELNLGIVAKIDIEEIREPFMRAGLLALIFAVAAVFSGTILFVKITGPVLVRLRDSEAGYKQLFDNLGSGVAIYEAVDDGKDFVFKDMNKTGERLGEVKKKEILGKRITEVFPAVKEFGLLDILQEVSQTGEPRHHPTSLYRDNRLSLWVEGHVYRLQPGQIVSVYRDMTDQIKAETDRDRMFNLSHDLFCISGMNGLFRDVNPAWETVLGYTREELIQRPFFELIHPDDHERCRDEMKRLATGVRTTGFRNRYRSRDGSYHTIEWIATPDVSQGLIYCVGRDITDRIRAETETRRSEAYMNSIFKVAPIGIGVVSNRVITRVNNRICEMVGYSSEQLIGQSSRILYPDDEEFERVGREKYEEIRKSGSGSILTRWMHQNGRIINVLLSSTPIDPADLEAGVTFTALDITARVEAEREIRNSHETLLAVLDSIDATIYVADMENYEILFMNKTMRDSFGGDLVGQTCWKAFRNESRPCPECTNPLLLDRDGSPTGVSIWEGMNPINGKWYINYDRAIRWVDGRIVHLQVATDISKVKELEEERLKAETQLVQAQKMEAIGTLAGGIAHDFNNILGVIVGNAELAMMEISGTESVGRNLLEIHKASMRARDLVKQILTFSRRSEHEMIPVQMSPIVKEVLKMLRSTLPATIEIKQFVDPAAGTVVVDPTQIHQILMNLCTNAGYAMRESGGILTIRLENVQLTPAQAIVYPELETGTYISLVVGDTGAGIDPSIIKRIFDPYFTTKPLGEGTGMGLALVHGIVKQCGGAIHVRNEPGKGTTFTLLFPMVETRIESERKVQEDIPKGSETVLFVDDEDAIVEMGEFMLSRLGYTVIGKTSSLEALKIFREEPEKFDLVITDQTMPKMTGRELAKELMAARPDIPIILCTGFSEIINEEKAREIGIREFILKPIIMSDLAKVIRRLLDSGTETES